MDDCCEKLMEDFCVYCSNSSSFPVLRLQRKYCFIIYLRNEFNSYRSFMCITWVGQFTPYKLQSGL